MDDIDLSTLKTASVTTLSWILRRLVPNMPGKLRLGRLLLCPFYSQTPCTLNDRAGCTYVLPSYAESIAQQLFTYGAYELDTQNVILKYLPEKGTFIDLGANIGALTIPIAKARPQASVISVEADPNIVQLLRHNVERNRCERVHVISDVVGPTEEQRVPFYAAPARKFGMGSLAPQFSEPPVILTQSSLDAILARVNIDNVDVIKIDVEGAELGVFLGAKRLLNSKRPPVIVFEFIDWAEGRIPHQEPGDAQAFLLAEGYRLFCLESGGRLGPQLNQALRRGSAMLIALPGRFTSGRTRTP